VAFAVCRRISAWRSWKKALRAAGLDAEGRGCHVARHTRACLLYAETRDLRIVGRELEHTDVRTTTVYADV
jgi:integrase